MNEEIYNEARKNRERRQFYNSLINGHKEDRLSVSIKSNLFSPCYPIDDSNLDAQLEYMEAQVCDILKEWILNEIQLLDDEFAKL